MTFSIKQPESPEEFKHYYALRHRILRAPWGEPEGSEVDNIEDQCFHVMVIDDEKVVGVGRLQYNTVEQAQIRYMAVDAAYEGHGIGRMIVNALEQEAANNNISMVVLDAREPAVGFYRKLGYQLETKSYLLFGEIQHYRMKKSLNATGKTPAEGF